MDISTYLVFLGTHSYIGNQTFDNTESTSLYFIGLHKLVQKELVLESSKYLVI
jgi:hypothetical protein